jgi:hypothetical protein
MERTSPADVIERFWAALAAHDVPRMRALFASDRIALRVAGVRGSGGTAYGRGLVELMLAARHPYRIVDVTGPRVIVERYGDLHGAGLSRLHVILALARIESGRIESWEERFDPELVAHPDSPPAEKSAFRAPQTRS